MAVKPKPKPLHPLAGAGVIERGLYKRQAIILNLIPSRRSSVGDLALIEFGGRPATRRLVPLTELALSDRWTLFASAEALRDYCEGCGRQGRRPGRASPPPEPRHDPRHA